MSRLQHPLDPSAVSQADDAFYREYPHMVDEDGTRQPIDPDTQPREAARWRVLYQGFLPEEESGEEENVEETETAVPCEQEPEGNDYLHVFVLVPGTTRPVNNLFDFAIESDGDHSAGRSYWIESLIDSMDKLKTDADNANSGDPEYHSCSHYGFNWSGDNNHNARVTAGRRLADELWNTYSAWGSKEVFFHLVGHSHGGNTINNFTETISGSDSRVQFGDRWFVKSITYLSTPFFQKIEQPNSTRIHASSIIFNIRNFYDLTQLCIADFIVHQATSGSLEELKPLLDDIKDQFAELSISVNDVQEKIGTVVSAYGEYLKEQASNLVPFRDDSHVAERAYERAKRDLNRSIADLKADIDALAAKIIALIEVLEGYLLSSQNPRNAALIAEMQVVLTRAKADIEWVRSNSQQMIDYAADFEVSSLLSLIFQMIEKIMGAIADIVRDDRIFRIIILFALNILQFFDDTLQDNSHYSALSSFTNTTKEVDVPDPSDASAPSDPYNNRLGYQRLRDAIEPHEAALHQHFPNSIRSFDRGKWSGFDTTVAHLTPIFRVLIAQVSAQSIRPYKEYPASVKRQADNINRWNARADWLPFYDGADLERYMTSISNSSDAIASFVDSILEQDLNLYVGTNAMSGETPGTIPYLAVVSHSISRKNLANKTIETLVGHVTRG